MRAGRFTGFLAFLTVVMSNANADGERNYEGVFAELELQQTSIELLKRHDRWVFADGQSKYIGLPKIAEKGLVTDRQNISFHGFLSRQNPYIGLNEEMMVNVFFAGMLWSVNASANSDILIYGAPSFEYLERPEFSEDYSKLTKVNSDPEVTLDIVETVDEKCRIYRSRSHFTILRTLAVVIPSPELEDKQAEQRKTISCVNRAIYFHFGFSNILNVSDEAMSTFDTRRQGYTLNRTVSLRPAKRVLSGVFAGLERKAYLRRMAEYLSNYEAIQRGQ